MLMRYIYFCDTFADGTMEEWCVTDSQLWRYPDFTEEGDPIGEKYQYDTVENFYDTLVAFNHHLEEGSEILVEEPTIMEVRRAWGLRSFMELRDTDCDVEPFEGMHRRLPDGTETRFGLTESAD